MTDGNNGAEKLKLILIPDALKKDGIDWEFLEKVKLLAEECFENPRYQEVYRLHNTWDNHVNNILEYIGKFCDKARFELKEHEGNILIAAAILHDIGKSLYLLHPDIRDGKFKDDATVLDALENSHHIISFLFIRSLFDYKNRDKVIEIFEKEDLFKTVLNKMQADFPLTSTASSIIVKPKWMEYLQCAAWMALRHKQLKEKQLHIFKPDLKDYFKKDSKPVDDETYVKEALNFFGKETKDNPEIKEVNEFLNANQETDDPDRFSILSALLQLGDKLDISKKRLQMSYFYLEVLLDDITDREVLRDNLLHPQSLTRWFQFYYTGEPTIESIPKDANSKNIEETGVKIIIPYFYPESIRKDFLYFRYKAEKDFEDLGIISTLERALKIAKNNNEDFRIIIERTENKKNGNPLRIIGLESRKERLTYCLRKICEECLKTGEKELKFDDVSEKINKVLEKTVKTFSCFSSLGLDPSKKCPLAEVVMSIFEKDTCQASYPGWEKYSFMLQANRYSLLCRKSINSAFDYDRRKECLRELKGKRIRLSLSRQAREGVKLWKEDAVKDRNRLPSGTIFYPHESSARFIPVSLDIAYLLNLFRHLRGESLTIEDIVAISGLDRGRILKYCGWLEHEQYLLLDDKAETYKINLDPAKYSIVERVLKDFDFRRSEMVSKIRDIDRFGKPLALYSDLNDLRLKATIIGLDRIISPFDEKLQGLPLRKSILLVGPPGSGKTTLALDIVRQVRLQRLPEETALYLTFAGDIQRVAEDNAPLGWDYPDIAACVRSLSTLQSKTYLNDPDKFFKHLLNILDEFSPDLVAVDNLGYFLQLTPQEDSREILNRLTRVLTVRGITSILIGDDAPCAGGFETYDTDGVIYLHYKDGQRALEITKMRGREFAGGRHSFKIKGLSEEDKRDTEKRNKPVITVFPNIQMHLEYAQRKKIEVEKKQEPNIIKGIEESEKKQVLKSGIKGLDELLPIYSEKEDKKNGFEKGEIILVIGSPGAGKTVSGLHFLAEGYNKEGKKEQEKKQKHENVLWVSFESDLDGLQLATRSFGKDASVKKLVIEMENNKDKMFRFFPPAQLDPNELVNFLLDACVEKKLDRLVLDSVNDIEQAFDLDMAFKSFMTSLVQLLRENGVTVMFLYRTRSFFGKSEDIGRTLTSVVDTIICLKVLEIQNAVQKGLFLLKVRGREHKSRLLSIDFKDDEGMSVLDSGWTMSGLISGEAGEIKEPRVSVKLFFENRNEFLINALIVSEYNRRFKGGQTTFVHVRKPQIYSEFWSFKGSSGAGHSNVRVVSLCDYWAAHFQRQEKLYDLVDYVSAAAYQLVYREEFWRRCASYSFKKNAFEIFSIPNYVDIGVLAFHEDIIYLESFWQAVDLDSPQLDTDLDPQKLIEYARKQLARLTWNNLYPTEDIMIIVSGLKKNDLLRYLFAMPSLEAKASFVSFFLELYWSFGGVIFDLRKLFYEYARECSHFLSNTEAVIKVEDLQFFKTPAIELKGNMAFIAEILMLIPERILNNTIRYMNEVSPNFKGDICRHGEVLLEKLLKKQKTNQSEKTSLSQVEKKSAITDIDDPLEAFFEIYTLENGKIPENYPLIVFIDILINELKKDDIWDGERKERDLLFALEKTKELMSIGITTGNENEKKQVLIILYFVVSRIISNRERYQKLLEWRFNEKKKAMVLANLEEIIQICDKNSAAIETFEYLFQLVNSGIAPNPHRGDFTGHAYLARKWSGDVAPRPKLPKSEGLFGALDLNMPHDAYEYKTADIEKTNYRIAPLPSYEREKIDEKGTKKVEKLSCAVMGLWSLGITKPALSPEIGWIFIDALTEDKFVELRARKGLGLPAKVSAYERESIRKAQLDIYGTPDDKENLKDGIVQYYDLATQDKAKKEEPTGNNPKDIVQRRTRERVSIPYYYQIEEFLIKELSRFFEPSFFAILAKNDDDRKKLISDVLQRIHNRIKNFLVSELKLDEKDKSGG